MSTDTKIKEALSRLKAQRNSYQQQIDNKKFLYDTDLLYTKMKSFDLAIEIVEDALR